MGETSHPPDVYCCSRLGRCRYLALGTWAVPPCCLAPNFALEVLVTLPLVISALDQAKEKAGPPSGRRNAILRQPQQIYSERQDRLHALCTLYGEDLCFGCTQGVNSGSLRARCKEGDTIRWTVSLESQCHSTLTPE